MRVNYFEHANGYMFPATCPTHGEPLVPLVQARNFTTECSAIARCPRCKVEYQLLVRLVPVAPQATGICGTDAGYRRHYREGTEVCEACRLARADRVRQTRPSRAKVGI